jgi:hypothetical protein
MGDRHRHRVPRRLRRRGAAARSTEGLRRSLLCEVVRRRKIPVFIAHQPVFRRRNPPSPRTSFRSRTAWSYWICRHPGSTGTARSNSPAFNRFPKVICRPDQIPKRTLLRPRHSRGICSAYRCIERTAIGYLHRMGSERMARVASSSLLASRDDRDLLAAAPRMAAQSLRRSQSAFGEFCRRMRAKLGAPKAITAAAHKPTRIIYHMLKTRESYDQGVFARLEIRYRQRVESRLKAQARALGLALIPAAIS